MLIRRLPPLNEVFQPLIKKIQSVLSTPSETVLSLKKTPEKLQTLQHNPSISSIGSVGGSLRFAPPDLEDVASVGSSSSRTGSRSPAVPSGPISKFKRNASLISQGSSNSSISALQSIGCLPAMIVKNSCVLYGDDLDQQYLKVRLYKQGCRKGIIFVGGWRRVRDEKC